MKTTLIILGIVALVGVAGFAWAKSQGYCGEGGHTQFMADRLEGKLDLDEGQRAQLDDLTRLIRELRGNWVEQRTQVRDEVVALISAPTLDRDQAEALLERGRQAMLEHRREVVDAFADFSDSLEPDQRARLAEMVEQRMLHRWGPHTAR
jgi:Spy/CpxP family protein refolding chaperone